MEIERKFLVRYLPEEEPKAYIEIEQGYISTSPVIRFRSKKKNTQAEPFYVLTIKGKGMVAREEHELILKKEQYEDLKGRRIGCLIRKTRYLYPLGTIEPAGASGVAGVATPAEAVANKAKLTELIAEVDVFDGDQKGLVMVEVEFPDQSTCEKWEKPDWFGKEVSLDHRYHNSNMINKDWKNQFTLDELEEWKIDEHSK